MTCWNKAVIYAVLHIISLGTDTHVMIFFPNKPVASLYESTELFLNDSLWLP